MTPEDLLKRAGDQLSVRRVFGEPVEREGTLVIPVAVAIGGGSGGTAPADQGGEGGGFGGVVRGIGVYSVREGQVRFVPAVDLTALALVSLLLIRTVFRAHRRRHLRHRTDRRGRLRSSHQGRTILS